MEWVRTLYWTLDQGEAIVTVDALSIDALK